MIWGRRKRGRKDGRRSWAVFGILDNLRLGLGQLDELLLHKQVCRNYRRIFEDSYVYVQIYFVSWPDPKKVSTSKDFSIG